MPILIFCLDGPYHNFCTCVGTCPRIDVDFVEVVDFSIKPIAMQIAVVDDELPSVIIELSEMVDIPTYEIMVNAVPKVSIFDVLDPIKSEPMIDILNEFFGGSELRIDLAIGHAVSVACNRHAMVRLSSTADAG